LQQQLGVYKNIEVEWVPGMTPTAYLIDTHGVTLKQFEITDKDLDQVLEDLKNNGLEPVLRTAEYPDTPLASTEFGGHHYELYHVPSFFHEAKTFAESKEKEGEKGYLLTITSKTEDVKLREFLDQNQVSAVWLGAQDTEEEGNWKWIGGPEKEKLFWSKGTSTENEYVSWKEGEPNDVNNEDCGAFTNEGWNDELCDSTQLSVVVEYGSSPLTSEKADL